MADVLMQKIEAALMSYTCTVQRRDDPPEEGMPLVDVLSHGFPTIRQGREEIELLAEHIAEALEPLSAGSGQ